MPPSQRHPRASNSRLELSQRPPAAPKPTYSETIEAARSQVETYTNDIFWHRIHDSRGAVRSEYQFREGDYGTAIRTLERLLRSLGLWDVLTNPTPPCDASEEEQDEWEILEAWAVNHTLPFVCDSILDRWTLERPINGPQLLKFLETTACKPFRLLELPTELREHVYDYFTFSTPAIQRLQTARILTRSDEYTLITNDGYDDYSGDVEEWITYNLWAKSWDHDDDDDDDPYEHGPEEAFRKDANFVCLSLVSREFRDAAVERYFGRAVFRIHVYGLEPLLAWATKVGLNKLRHLRRMTVRIHWYSDEWDDLFISYDPLHGLKAELDQYNWPRTPTRILSYYTSRITRRNIETASNSTGVIECFTSDPDALRMACWGSRYISGATRKYHDAVYGTRQRQRRQDRIDERNAYEVAYGCLEPDCPW